MTENGTTVKELVNVVVALPAGQTIRIQRRLHLVFDLVIDLTSVQDIKGVQIRVLPAMVQVREEA